MKKLVLILSILMIGLNCSAKDGATIDFTTKIHDFGQIAENDKTASFNFDFKNSGNAPLVIHKAVASCGCTTPDYPKEPIAPGATATIKVTYNTVGRPGAFHKTITVFSNDTDVPNIVLIIKGDVTPKEVTIEDVYPIDMQGLRLKKSNVVIFDAKIGSVKSETIEFVNTSQKTMNISFNKLPKHIKVTASNSRLEPNQTGVLTIKYTPSLTKDYGKRLDSFFLVTNPNDKLNPNNKIKISAIIMEDFDRLTADQRLNAPLAAFSDYRINLGKMASGVHKTAEITLSNKGKTTLYLRKIIPEYDGIKVTPEKKEIPAGKTIKVKIDFNSGTFEGSVVKNITFITNDPKNSSNKIFLTAQVTNN